jgi:hypothetical protein
MIHFHADDGSLWTDALGYQERNIADTRAYVQHLHVGNSLGFLSVKVPRHTRFLRT